MTRLPMVLAMAVAPLLVGAIGASAEESPSGARVRVTAPSVSGKRLVGVLVGLDETTLTLQRPGAKGSLQVPRAAITKIEASRHRSRKAAGAGIGMLIGLGAAAVVGLATGDDCGVPHGGGPGDLGGRRGGGLFCLDKGDMALISGILIVPATTLLGLVASPGEKWEISTADRLRIAVAPARGGGVRAALAIRF